MNTGRLRAWVDSARSWRRLSVVGTALLAAAGIVFVIRTVEISDMISLVSEADPALLGAALVLYGVSWPLRGRRYGDVLAAMDRRFSGGFLTSIIFVSQTANLVVPARGGDGVRAHVLKKRHDTPYPIGVASLAVERAFDLVAITVLGGVAFLWLFFDNGAVLSSGLSPGRLVAVGVGSSVTALSILTVGFARSDLSVGPTIRSRIKHPRLSRFVDAAVRFGTNVRVVARSPRAILTISLGSLAVWVLDVLTAVAVLAALGAGGLSGWGLVAVGTLAVSVGNLAKVLPLSQGGIGLYEAAFTGLVVSIAPVGIGTAVTAAILDHALKNAVTLVGGSVAAIAIGTPAALGRPELDDSVSRPIETDESGSAATEPPKF